jgi:hypothetical protein
LLIVLIILWNIFFVYVGPEQMLIITAKNGEPLPAGQTVAEPGQKGVQRKVLGEGYHFVMPIVYETETRENFLIPPGMVGVVTNLGGKSLPDGRILVEETEKDTYKGIRRKVLPPGRYRLNPYAVRVDQYPATLIRPGYVGVLRRLLGDESTSQFAENDNEKGYLRDVLQPGLYYINPKEYEVIFAEVGIYQTTFRYEKSRAAGEETRSFDAISFQAKDSYRIEMDFTVEWEMLPDETPILVVEFGTRKEGDRTVVDLDGIERKVIYQHANRICQNRGFNYNAQEFLEGDKREQFQLDFAHELARVCREENVVVRTAFIRRIVIPEELMETKRARQIAAEKKETNVEQKLTADTEADLEEAEKDVEVAEAQVHAETSRLVAGIERDTENIGLKTDAEIEKLTAEYEAQIAELDAERTKVLGEAEAEAKKLKETATASIYKMKMEVFQNKADAYLRYQMAQELNPKIVLRLFHSGPGTLWTNMGNKDMNFLMPIPRERTEKPVAQK